MIAYKLLTAIYLEIDSCDWRFCIENNSNTNYYRIIQRIYNNSYSVRIQ